jgi:hypothetical protein
VPVLVLVPRTILRSILNLSHVSTSHWYSFISHSPLLIAQDFPLFSIIVTADKLLLRGLVLVGFSAARMGIHAFAPILDQIQLFILRFGKIYKLRLFLRQRFQSMESLLNWIPFC